MAMRPLEKLPSIRAKLGSVIVIAVGVTVVLVFLMLAYALRDTQRGAERLDLLKKARRAAAGEIQAAPAESGISIVRVSTTGAIISGTPPAPLPTIRDGLVHVGRTDSIDFAVAPVVIDGRVVQQVFAVRARPATSFTARIGATLRFLSAFWWQFLVAGAVSAGIALVMARWLARGTTQPLRDMTAAAR